jgi:hypothetical protein
MRNRILAMATAMTITVPSGLLLGLYGETTKEYQERKFSREPKVTIQLQQLREELAELRRRADPLGGQEVGMKIRQIEKEIADLENSLATR